jgi:protein-S-isoprenylcysteine O-methyltransferase Ste14
MPDLWIYGFHALFYATFLPRLLSRRARPAPAAAAPATTARFSRGVLGIHAFAMFVLYLGVGAVVSGRSVRFLFAPQPVAGALVMLAAAGLAVWTLAVFGSWRLRARIEADHELSTNGPFRFVRNPIYLGMIVLALGTFLWMPNGVVLAGLLLVILASDLRARAEEKVLLAAFGDCYREYAARVKRFVPGVY